jgi:hypothetical protein
MGWARLIAVKVAGEGCDRLSGRQPGKPGCSGRGWVVGVKGQIPVTKISCRLDNSQPVSLLANR